VKKLGAWTVITGGFTVLFLVLLIVAIVSFVQRSTLVEPRGELVNSSIVHIEENRTHQIFLEDRLPPMLARHDFIFTNIETGERIASRPPAMVTTYTIGGAHGRMVATVDLAPGSYAIEFEPWDGGGIFVWGTNIIGIIFGGVVSIAALGIAAVLSLALFVTLLVSYLLKRKAKRREVVHENFETYV